MLERDDEPEDTDAKIRYFRSVIEQHHAKHPMASFSSAEGTNSKNNDAQGNKRKRGDNQGGGGDAPGISAEDCAELEAHGYVVEPRDIEDESGYAIRAFYEVRQPLSIYAQR